jgi:biotin transport system substrate-specific component
MRFFTMKNKQTRDIAHSGILLAILIISAQIAFPFNNGINFTFQLFVIFIISFIIKWQYGTIVIFSYILIGLLGIPVFSGFNGGFSIILKPNFGYLIGFVFAPIMCQMIYKTLFRSKIKTIYSIICSTFCFVLFDYLIASIYVYFMIESFINLSIIYNLLIFPFIIFDFLKCVIAALIIVRIDNILNLNEKEYKIEYFENLSSTNDFAKSNYEKYESKNVFYTNNQEKGRGSKIGA